MTYEQTCELTEQWECIPGERLTVGRQAHGRRAGNRDWIGTTCRVRWKYLFRELWRGRGKGRQGGNAGNPQRTEKSVIQDSGERSGVAGSGRDLPLKGSKE